MANHLRRQIREAVGTAVTGLATTGARVFQSRVYPLPVTDLPGLTIATDSESSIGATLGAPRLIDRVLRLRVIAWARATADLDDTLDQICKEVEIALAMPCAALAGIAKTITLISTEIELEGTADKPVGQAALTYEINYIAAENAPDTAQ
jgi:hypothetical protein